MFLLKLNLCLGEGSGVGVVLGLIKFVCCLYNEMVIFVEVVVIGEKV